MTQEQINALTEFAKFLDKQRNDITEEMWNEKIIWKQSDAFQEYLKYYLHVQPGPIKPE